MGRKGKKCECAVIGLHDTDHILVKAGVDDGMSYVRLIAEEEHDGKDGLYATALRCAPPSSTPRFLEGAWLLTGTAGACVRPVHSRGMPLPGSGDAASSGDIWVHPTCMASA